LRRFDHFIYSICWFLLKVFYPKPQFLGLENIPDNEPVIFVGNHCQMNGPIVSDVFFTQNKHYTWCIGQMMNWKEVPAYAFEDFWSEKPKWIRPFFKLLSYIIVPLSVALFNNAKTIAVYHDGRLISTYKQSIEKLQEGSSLVIFPEQNIEFNNILYEFQDKFIDTARFYYKKTGKEVLFVPIYLAPKIRKFVIGKPIRFDSSNKIEDERKRLCDYLKQSITDMAVELPRHRVVPYRNIPKRFYPYNEVTNVEKTDG